MKEKTKVHILFIVCILLFLGIQVTEILSDVNQWELRHFNGVLSACQFALCLLMVRRDHRKGIIVSLILMGIAGFFLLRAMVFMRLTEPVPGFCNTIIYIVTLILLGKQFKIREDEAITDILTGLPNRRGLYKLLKKRIEDEKEFHVVYVDLGNFKFINDNYGHTYGDYLMRVVADRMNEVVGNEAEIARIGGDEFVIAINGDKNPGEIAQKIIEKLSERITLHVDNIKADSYLTCFAGIASYPKDSKSFEDLIKYADIAMYEATKDKGDKVRFFDKDMKDALNRRIELERLIKDGLENDYFYLVYQPQYKLDGKKLRGFESLLRMKTPEGVFVSPGEFIPVAEKGELILQIDDYVMKRAMNEFKAVVQNAQEDITISINVSAKNIAAIEFPEKIKKVLDETGFPAKNLEIEITEYCLVKSVDVTIDNIKKLRAMGIQVALDDFGTGYTSLSYLAKMPINLLKIDKSLVDNIEKSDKSRDFVNAVISMGHLMGCEVISEGVESEGQLKLLGIQSCDFVQGYVWGKPLDYDVAKALTNNKDELA